MYLFKVARALHVHIYIPINIVKEKIAQIDDIGMCMGLINPIEGSTRAMFIFCFIMAMFLYITLPTRSCCVWLHCLCIFSLWKIEDFMLKKYNDCRKEMHGYLPSKYT
jgi:hypothetical protein